MKTLTIAELTSSDAVQDALGRVGEVIGFDRDTVRVSWGEITGRYTDAQLTDLGITRWSPVQPVQR